MHYIRTDQGGAGKYHGAIAQGYDQKREADPKWQLEQAIIEDMLSDLAAGSWVLDCPIGTGRFLAFHGAKGFIVRGVDVSHDMLQQAADKANKLAAQGELDPHKVRLSVGDVRSTELSDKCVDAAVMCRLTRWLSPEDCQVALRELQRVTRKKIIFTARVANHPHARTLDLFEAVLDGWKIARMEAGADIDYRIIELRPC